MNCYEHENFLLYQESKRVTIWLRNVLKRGGLMDEKDLWQSVLNEIYPEVNSASYHAWFNDLKLIKIKENKVYIQVPMEIHKRILTQNYYNLIDDAFYKLTNRNYEFEFLLKDEIHETISIDAHENVDNVDNSILSFVYRTFEVDKM